MPPRRQGMTLVEVLAGLVLLGVVVGMMLVVRGRFMTKAAEAERRAAGVRVLDELMNEWWGKPEAMPVGGSGEQDGWQWRVEKLGRAAEGIGDVVRVEVSDARGVEASVEVVVPGAVQVGKGGANGKGK